MTRSPRGKRIGLSVRQRYSLLRWSLVQLRRLARRYSINFDNAAESSRKALGPPSDPQGRP